MSSGQVIALPVIELARKSAAVAGNGDILR